MNKRDKALIELLGILTTEIVVISANISLSQASKMEVGANKRNAFNRIGNMLKENVNKIESIVKEATNEQY